MFQQTQTTMASPTVIATKNGRTRKFTEYQWALMGTNKEGWIRTEDISVKASEIPAPPTGEKKKPVVKEMKVEGSEDKKDAPVEGEKSDMTVKGDIVTEEQKSDFLLAVTGLTKSAIKNFFDKVSHPYDNKSNANELKTLLGEYFKYNLDEYDSKFSA